MKKRTMIIVTLVAIVLVGAGIFIAVQGFGPHTETETIENESLAAITPEDRGLEKEEEPDVKTEEDQADPKEENMEEGKAKDQDDTQKTQAQDESLSLKQYYDQMLNSGQPSIIVFSYDAECCESTRIFFENYNSQAYALMESYQDTFNTLFINTGTLSSEDMQTALKIAEDKGGAALPSLVVLDSQGEVYEIFEGTFQIEEVEEVLNGLKNA